MVRVDSSYLLSHIQSSGMSNQSDPKVSSASRHSTRQSSKRERKKPIVTNAATRDIARQLRQQEIKITDNEVVEDNETRTDERKEESINKAKEKKNGKKFNDTLKTNEREMIMKKTHLHLQRKHITHLDDMRYCKNLRVLFLQQNALKRVGHLRHLHSLQELYLNDNQILRIEGLNHLQCLKKLLVSRNRIGVVECLPPNLVELEASGQLLSAGDTMLLDPQAFMQVQLTLKLLDVSDNKLTEFGAVGLLNNLQILRASNNELSNLDHLCSVFGKLPRIVEIDLRGNPASLERVYRPEITLKSSDTLRLLDEKKISEETRAFFVNAAKYKEATKKPTTGDAQVQRTIFASEHFLFDQRKGHQSDAVMNADLQNETSKFILGSLKQIEFEAILSSARYHALTQRTHEGGAEPVTRMGLDEGGADEETSANSFCRELRIIPKLFLRHKQRAS